MNTEKFKEILAAISGVLGALFTFGEKAEFSKEQEATLDEAYAPGFAEKFQLEYNSFIENASANELITEFMQNQAGSEDKGSNQTANVISTEQIDEKSQDDSLLAKIKNLISSSSAKDAKIEKLQADNAKLAAEPENDTPVAKITVSNQPDAMNIVKHSATHLFGDTAAFNQITADRPWNKKAAEIQSKEDVIAFKGTDWNTVNIDKINEDFGAYARKNMARIISVMRNGLDIPSNWNIVDNVSDEIIFALIVSGQITQGKKKDWIPKNKQKFIPQKGKVYDKQIDATWTGYELKKIEKSWLNSFFNNVGSNPYKMSFVEYLMAELLKQARKEDKINIFKGVWFPNDDMQLPGDFMNAMSGLFKLIRSKAEAGEYNPFDLPKLNANNTYDTINKAVEMLPHWARILPNLMLYISPTDLKAYHDNRESQKGTYMDYAGKEPHVEGYANIKFKSIAQAEGTGFFFITTDNNIDLLIDKPGEESKIHFSNDGKRNINAHADYKQGVIIYVLGAQMPDGKLQGYDNQLFFSNKVELLEDVFVPVPGNLATPDLQYHHSLIVGEHNTAATNITNFLNATPGKKVYLRGNNDATPSTVKNNANIIIGADVVLTSTTELVLVAGPDGKFRKYAQNDLAAATTAVELAADATTADASEGKEFITQANTGATALTDITNAIAGEEYTIRGGSNTNATTIAASGKFASIASAMTLNDGTFIKVLYNGSVFIETARG